MYRFLDKERYLEIQEGLENIRRLGIVIKAIICDGHKSILKAVKLACEGVVVQRCLVHIHRESNIWLRKRPINESSKELKRIVNMIFKIKSKNDKKAWIASFLDWYQSNAEYLNEKQKNPQTGPWWYKHKNLRRSVVMIRKALPNMFHF